MAIIAWGDYSDTRSVEITPANVQVSTITAPVADSVHSTSVTVTYKLTSDQAPSEPELIFYVEFNKEGYGIDGQTWILADIQVEYSIDGGSTYSVCTEDTVAFSALSEGTENLLTSITGVVHNYVWDMLTDIGTNDYLTNAYIRIKAFDGEDWGAYLTSSAFIVDTVPIAPTYNDDSYINGKKIKDTTPEFNFTIPTDIGSDRLHFKIDWDTSSNFNTNNLTSRNSYDDEGFWHYHNNISPSGSYTANNYKKYGDWFFQITGVTTGGTYAFGDYKDYYKNIYLPAKFIDPKIIVIPNRDSFYYISQTSSTGFTVTMTSDSNFPDYSEITGGTYSTTLNCYLFEGAWSEYWVSNITLTTTGTNISYGSGVFATDDNGVAIPSTIPTGATLVIQPTSDCPVWITNRTSTGFQINRPHDNPSGDDYMGTPNSGSTVMVYVSTSTGNTYYEAESACYEVAVNGDTQYIFKPSLNTTDSLFQTVPAYIPGLQYLGNLNNRSTYFYNYDYRTTYDITGATNNFFYIRATRHPKADSFGNVTMNVSYWGCNADYFWVPISNAGISDDYENEKAKFIVQSADAYTSGNTYYYRIAAGNI